MTLFKALTGGAFDRLNWQHSGEFDQNFSKKSNARGFARGGMGGFGIDRYITLVTTCDAIDNSNSACRKISKNTCNHSSRFTSYTSGDGDDKRWITVAK